MKLSMKNVGCCGIVLSAAMLFAQAEAPKTIKVVGLEGDKDTATGAAPAERAAKPATGAVRSIP